MDYLVTGGAGFIGSNIVSRLVREGAAVRVLDNLATGRLSNIRDIRDAIEFLEGDVRDPETVKKAVRDVRSVLHLAALPSIVRSVDDPVGTAEVNVTGTLNLLIASRDGGVERFVFSSSSSVYGDTPTLPKHEAMRLRPRSPYAAQKAIGEGYVRIFHSLYGLNTFILRYFNVFGPRQNPDSQYAAAIPAFIKAFGCGEPPVIHGDGEQTRDFTFVDDVVSANLCCCRAPEDAAGGVYNIARGERTSINALVDTLGRLLDSAVKPVYDDSKPGDVRDSQGDASKAMKRLGWRSKAALEEGLKQTISCFRGK